MAVPIPINAPDQSSTEEMVDALLNEVPDESQQRRLALKVSSQRSFEDKKEYSIRQREEILKSEEDNKQQQRSEAGGNNKRKVSSISMLKKARYRPGAQFKQSAAGSQSQASLR